MLKYTRHLITFLGLQLAITASCAALGVGTYYQGQSEPISQLAQAAISEGQAAAIAKSQHGGKVLSVSKSNNNGRVIYRVKLLLDSGRVIIVSVDGQTGRVSG